MAPNDAECSIFLLDIISWLHNENIMEDIFRRAAEAPIKANIEAKATIKERILKVARKLAIKQRKQPLHIRHQTMPSDLLKLDALGQWDPHVFRAGIQVLNSFSLVKRNTSAGSYSVHPLVHLWSRDRLPDEHRQFRCCSASELLAHSITWDFLTTDYAFRRDLTPHIESCTLRRAEESQSESVTSEELNNFGLAYGENGFYDKALRLEKDFVKMNKKLFGEEDSGTMVSMYNLALTYWSLGRHKEAEELGVRVLEFRKRVLGEEHPYTLTTMHNLASAYYRQGHHNEAEELQVRVLELRKKVLGEEHPDTLTTMHNLAIDVCQSRTP